MWQHYHGKGRHDLPWRKTKDPYRILVSELMLQQTQVERVVPKYRAFLRAFPTARRLAAAPLRDVLRAWQGLGYNRRAKFLHQAAQAVAAEHKGGFPKDEAGLRNLSGVGPYTAGAIMAFANNEPVVLIETNVRQVFLHHFFRNKTGVSDTKILKRVEKTLPMENSREWYWALMDYGAYLKQQYGNVNHRSKHYKKQSKFTGSDRQIRGAIVRLLSDQDRLTKQQIQKKLEEFAGRQVAAQLACLVAEKMIVYSHTRYSLG